MINYYVFLYGIMVVHIATIQLYAVMVVYVVTIQLVANRVANGYVINKELL